MKFADTVFGRIKKVNSLLVAGFDPVLESLPDFAYACAEKEILNEDAVYKFLRKTYLTALDALKDSVAAIKPNLAFYEQFGIGGLRAYLDITEEAKLLGVLVIADAKRGDIGSTATAYSTAFLGTQQFRSKPLRIFTADAVTVNPFLGFDSLAPFVDACAEHDKGLFVLVKTSNPGSSNIQNLVTSEAQQTVSEVVANWISENSEKLLGDCGHSGLGAVVGATYPGEAISLRRIMPTSLFLIPGMGAQGAEAGDSVQGCDANGMGGLLNVSRGLFSVPKNLSSVEWQDALRSRASTYNNEIRLALESRKRPV